MMTIVGGFFIYYGVGVGIAIAAWYFNKEEDLVLGDLKPIALIGLIWPIAVFVLIGDFIDKHDSFVLIRRRRSVSHETKDEGSES